jgi:hypothetical protein
MPPALMSRFIADGLDGIYVAENLWLYAQCGSNAVRRDFADHMTSLKISTSGHRTPSCDAAYLRALSPYRSTQIIRLEK